MPTPVNYDDLCDADAIAILRDPCSSGVDRETAATFLEVSINGGDVDTLRKLGFELLVALERRH